MPSHIIDVKPGQDTIVAPVPVTKKELKIAIKREDKVESYAAKLLAKAKKDIAVKTERDIQRKAITAFITSHPTISASQVANKAKGKKWKWIPTKCNVCGEDCPSNGAVIYHIKQKHPSTKWACEYCGKQYNSFNGKYKHEKSVHMQKPYLCAICGHGFDYKSQVDRHMPVHNPSDKVYCDNCGKGFASKASLKWHEVVHLELEFKCDSCEKVYNTKDKRSHHWKGVHGGGFVSRCDKFTFKWPGAHHIHQVDCDECKEIKKLIDLRKFPSRSS